MVSKLNRVLVTFLLFYLVCSMFYSVVFAATLDTAFFGGKLVVSSSGGENETNLSLLDTAFFGGKLLVFTSSGGNESNLTLLDTVSFGGKLQVSTTGGESNLTLLDTASFGGKLSMPAYTWSNWSSTWIMYYNSTSPIISNPYPVNGSTNVALQPTCHIDVSDPNGDSMNLYWYNSTDGSTFTLQQINSSVGNGTFYWNYSMADTNATVYYWKVAVNDSVSNVTATYHFTTQVPSGYPVVVTNDSTGVEETNATLWGYLQDDGNETCNVWFEWGTTTSYGNTTVNQTATSGTEFSTFTAIIRPVEDSIPVDSSKYPGTGENAYEDIDDISPDNDSTYIYSTDDGNWDFNYFFFENITSNVTYLDTVTISIYAKVNNSNNNYSWVSARIFNRTNGDPLSSVWNSVLVDNDTNYHYYNHTWNTTYSGESWSKTDINNSEIAVYIYNGDGAYETRVTQVYITLEAGLTNLSPGQIYHYRAAANNSVGTSYGSDKTFLTKPYPPSSLTVSDYNHSHVDLTWLKGSGANKTIIRRSTSGYPSSPQSGTEVYNGTATSFDDTGVTAGSTVYYRAWSYSSWGSLQQFSDNNVSVNVTLPPQPPQNVSYILQVAGTKANITINWTIGVGADKTVVRKASGSSPATPQSGIAVYNGTGTNVTDINITQAWNYRLWSFNETTGLFSDPVDLNWFAVWLNCFNESTGEAIVNWSVFISNEEGTQTYTATNCSNSRILNLSLCPIGDKIAFQFSASGYYDRVYYLSIDENGSYTVNAYLPPRVNPVPPGSGDDGGNTTATQLYIITVVGPQGEYTSLPIEDALVTIKRYISETDSYENVSIQYTDANGQINVYLIPNILYKVIISKEGYETEISDYIPSDQIFTKTFRLTPVTQELPEYVDFWDTVTFTATMYENQTIYIVYVDSNESTIDTQIYVYDVYNSTYTLINVTSKTGNSSFSYYVSGVNISRTYLVVLFFNNTANFDVQPPVNLTVYPLAPIPESSNQYDVDEIVEPVVGPFPGGGSWATVLAIIIPVIVLVSFGAYNTGFGIIGAGMSLGLMQLLYYRWFTNSFNPLLAALVPFILAIGVLYMWTKGRGEQKI